MSCNFVPSRDATGDICNTCIYWSVLDYSEDPGKANERSLSPSTKLEIQNTWIS